MRPRPGEIVDYATRITLRELGRRAERTWPMRSTG